MHCQKGHLRSENSPYPEGHPRSFGECSQISFLPVQFRIHLTMSCIQTAVADHFKIFFQNVMDKTFDDIFRLYQFDQELAALIF